MQFFSKIRHNSIFFIFLSERSFVLGPLCKFSLIFIWRNFMPFLHCILHFIKMSFLLEPKWLIQECPYWAQLLGALKAPIYQNIFQFRHIPCLNDIWGCRPYAVKIHFGSILDSLYFFAISRTKLKFFSVEIGEMVGKYFPQCKFGTSWSTRLKSPRKITPPWLKSTALTFHSDAQISQMTFSACIKR